MQSSVAVCSSVSREIGERLAGYSVPRSVCVYVCVYACVVTVAVAVVVVVVHVRTWGKAG